MDRSQHQQRGFRPVTEDWEAARGYADDPRGPRGQWRDRPSWPEQQRADNQHRPDDQYRPDTQAHRHERPLYDREHVPFSRREDTHYYGTGSVGNGGPGFTGGAYAYGDGSRYPQTSNMEGEYSDESAVSYEHEQQGQQRPQRQLDVRGGYTPQTRQGYGVARSQRRYPPGPKGYQRSDERLQENISERLYEAYHIDSSEVSVTVSGAKVTLDGVVPSRHMKHAIEDLVDSCPGVTDIDNRVRVAGPNYQGSAPTTAAGQQAQTQSLGTKLKS